ncbi:Protein ABHD14B [Pseudolycoriella hygida]|uniref:Protein ABHD14B n=1 Tax=Pseudolycoriella hygida TaxID=35572 RepID=A0A9Q0MH89_9DIPT|nr:Protein ABHD14B [Pseudolycoriella hygida]
MKPTLNLKFCVVLLLVLSVTFVVFNFATTLKDTETSKSDAKTTNEKMNDGFWVGSVNIEGEIPGDVSSRAEKLEVIDKTVVVDGVKIFYRESSPTVKSEITLLLLHGKNFSSKTWLDLKTISFFTASGYRTIAIDLPGFGHSEKLPAKLDNKKSDFLLHVLTELKILKPVIVSPSYSGFYTLPMLLKNSDSFTGFVPVAPVGENVIESFNLCSQQGLKSANSYMSERFDSLPAYFKEQIKGAVPDVSCIKTPLLVVHGEFDRSRSSAFLSLFPNARAFEIPEGKHACYLQNPQLFHTVVYNFLLRITELKI